MSFRSSTFPDSLVAALELREKDHVCPAEVLATLQSISYFQKKNQIPRFPVKDSRPEEGFRNSDWRSGNRNTNQGRGSQNYRGGRQQNVSDDGFQVWNGGGRRRGNEDRRYPSTRPAAPVAPAPPAPSPPLPSLSRSTSTTSEPETVPESSQKFSSAAVKAVAVEDRMLARIKGKINKIGPSTYEATKVFMQQILSGDETEFLDECMKFIFQKAATESAFCSLYAKLLHELADEFSHLRTIMVELFRDYMAIFTEVESSPDVGTSDYKAFLEAQERKKFRRGYSQFVGELVKLGEAEEKDFSRLIQQIVSVIETNYTDVSKTLLCEEYIDCLANLCNCASAILVDKEWSLSVKLRLEELVKKPRSEMPGLTNKGRFALMDLVDSTSRWQK